MISEKFASLPSSFPSLKFAEDCKLQIYRENKEERERETAKCKSARTESTENVTSLSGSPHSLITPSNSKTQRFCSSHTFLSFRPHAAGDDVVCLLKLQKLSSPQVWAFDFDKFSLGFCLVAIIISFVQLGF